jgi:hypothetical protein
MVTNKYLKKMKTKMNISNLKKMAITLFVALMIPAGSFTQAKPDANENDEYAALSRLENYMDQAAQAVRYIAPNAFAADVEQALANLDLLADLAEDAIQYEAPAVDYTEFVAPEFENLNAMAELAENGLRYLAPSVEAIDGTGQEVQNLEMLTAAVEQSVNYVAPDVCETQDFNDASAKEVVSACEAPVFNQLISAR